MLKTKILPPLCGRMLVTSDDIKAHNGVNLISFGGRTVPVVFLRIHNYFKHAVCRGKPEGLSPSNSVKALVQMSKSLGAVLCINKQVE